MFPGFKTYYKETITKKVWYWNKNICIDQWNITKSPEINSHTNCQLIFNKGVKTIQ